jgi:hypothetical protein
VVGRGSLASFHVSRRNTHSNCQEVLLDQCTGRAVVYAQPGLGARLGLSTRFGRDDQSLRKPGKADWEPRPTTDCFRATNHESLPSLLRLDRIRIIHDIDNLYAGNNSIRRIVEVPVRTNHCNSKISDPVRIRRGARIRQNHKWNV